MRGPASLLVVSLVSACTSPNPAFFLSEGGGGGTGGSSAASSSGDGGDTSSSTSTPGSSSSSTTSAGGTDPVGSTSVGGETTTTGVDSASGGGSTGGSTGGCVEAEKVPAYTDGDGDGWGAGDPALLVCPGEVPAGHALLSGDCDDGKPEVNPGATETCDMLDDDCNGLVDEYSAKNATCFGCKLYNHEGRYYFLCGGPSTAPIAIGLCEVWQGDGGEVYLATIDTLAEHQFLAPLVMMAGFDAAIGLADVVGGNKLTEHLWTDATPLGDFAQKPGMEPWAPGEPKSASDRWTMIETASGRWNDISSLALQGFVCEGEPKP